MKIGSLFSGIGGLELGLERAGVGNVIWQVEIDPFCRRVLAKHWPNVDRSITDVKQAMNLSPVDLICGGFPCQDVSSAGKRKGLAGEKSGLWFEYRRIVGELRPRFVVVENVASGKKAWLPTVKEDLAALGYRTRAYALSAADVGAPHLRRRIFVVADANGPIVRQQSRRGERKDGKGSSFAGLAGLAGQAGNGNGNGNGKSAIAFDGEVSGMRSMASDPSPWATPPEFRRVANGIPLRLDRLRALGNAVVPQCAEVIGRIICESII